MFSNVEPSPKKFGQCNAPFDECKVTLALYGEDLDPDVVSKRLGREPTTSLRRGARRSTNGPPAEHGTWLFSVRGEPPQGPSDLAIELLDRFPSDPALWAALCRDYQVQIRFAFQGSTLTGCFELDPVAAARLSATGATLAFHLYSTS